MIIDVSSGVGEWAFDPLGRTSPQELSYYMEKEGILMALVSPVEGICYKNPHTVIQKHFERLKPFPGLIPVPVINPLLADSEKQAETAFEMGAPALKLYPGYHGYDPGCLDSGNLLGFCGKTGMAAMFQARVEDSRRQHRVFNVPMVETGAILDAIEKYPGTTVIICGLTSIKGEERERILKRERTYIDTAFLEYMDTLNYPLCSLDGRYDRIMFGSHSPFFYMRANVLKLKALEKNVKAHEQVSFKNVLGALNLKDRYVKLAGKKEGAAQ